jgi:hypothetical protein
MCASIIVENNLNIKIKDEILKRAEEILYLANHRYAANRIKHFRLRDTPQSQIIESNGPSRTLEEQLEILSPILIDMEPVFPNVIHGLKNLQFPTSAQIAQFSLELDQLASTNLPSEHKFAILCASTQSLSEISASEVVIFKDAFRTVSAKMEEDREKDNFLITEWRIGHILKLLREVTEENKWNQPHDCVKVREYWDSLITVYATCGFAIDAIDTLHKMPKFDIKPDNISYALALRACSHARPWKQSWKLAETLVEEITQESIPMSIMCINEVMRACHAAEQWERCIYWMEQLSNRKFPCEANDVTWHYLASALASANEEIRLYKSILDPQGLQELKTEILSEIEAISSMKTDDMFPGASKKVAPTEQEALSTATEKIKVVTRKIWEKDLEMTEKAIADANEK